MFQAKKKHKVGKKQSGRKVSILFHFVYLDERYSMHATQMGRFFGVGYDHLIKSHHKGIPDQDIADEAAARGGDKPKAGIIRSRWLRRKLV